MAPTSRKPETEPTRMAPETGALRLEPGELRGAVNERLRAWEEDRFAERLWAKDPTLWADHPLPPELADRLGWLDLPRASADRLGDAERFAEEVRAAGYDRAVLLGMGGSSLAPEVFGSVFAGHETRAGALPLTVLDSTHPAAVRAVERACDPVRTLFLVASKSGTTVETLSLFRWFWHRIDARGEEPGPHFVAITDPGSPLEELAAERGFRRTFGAPPDVGGRFSALSEFGLVPAVLSGVDAAGLLERARAAAVGALGEDAGINPALRLGAALGEAARAGRDKLTFFAPAALAALPPWIEQLVAESTGKDGRGIVPVVDQPLLPAEAYGEDRFFVHLTLQGAPEPDDAGRLVRDLEEAGHPVAHLHLPDRLELGAQMLLWEIAVAAAGRVLAIHPFDQPDVELAKRRAKEALQDGGAPDAGTSPGLEGAAADALEAWAARAEPPRYAAIQAFLAPSPEIDRALRALQRSLAERTGVATSAGYGPRFLHSTGQLHKGGPDTGLFLQLVDAPAEELPIPETDTSFRALIRAQAVGDHRALEERGRRIVRLELGDDPAGGLERLRELLRRTL